MATLAFGIAGAAIGSGFGALGASIGFQLGSLLGNALFPEKVQGPRLSDLRVHTSTYGGITPRLWGTVRMAGNIIDGQDKLQEHEEKSGGKGGPEVTNFTYSLSFAVRLCERIGANESAILGIGRIWANGRTVDKSSLPMTIYLGTEDQLPDPTLETIHDVGNVPGYRGVAYVVFNDLFLTDYGNAIPNFEFEVYTDLEGSIPRQVSIVDGGTPNRHGSTYEAGNGLVTLGNYLNGNYDEYTYDLLTGELVGTSSAACEPISDVTLVPPSAISNPTEGIQAACLGHNGEGIQQAWYYKQNITHYPFCGPIDGFGLRYDNPGALVDGAIYNIGHPASFSTRALCKWSCDADGRVLGLALSTEAVQQYSDSTYRIATSDDGFVYVYYHGASLSGVTPIIDKFDSDLNLVRTWTAADLPGIWTLVGESFVVYQGMIAVTYANAFTPQTIIVYDLDTLSPTSTPIGSLTIGGVTAQGISRVHNGYCIVGNGFVSLDRSPGPVPLSRIVADISSECALADDEIDVTDLPDLVDGYIANQQGSGRDWIQPLRDAWFFDAFEGDVVTFVKRGKDAVVTIPDDDLAAHNFGEDPPPILGTVRGDELALPRVVNVSFMDPDADYQTGTQPARRQVTHAQSEISINLPINMSNPKAKSVAEGQLYTAHIERNKHAIFTSRKYLKYTPTDVFKVRGRDMRVVEKNEVRAGVLKWDLVQSVAQTFIQPGIAATRLEFTTSPPTVVPVSTLTTTAYLLDLPLVSDSDDPNGFYAAMGGVAGWPGAGLFKSVDGGATYNSIVSTTTPAVTGTTSDALGSFYGGNTFDEGNVVTVVTTGGELASATETAVLNGANEALIGDEVVQFKNADLVDTDTYELTGLLRGRLGTEWAQDAHGPDERFVLLPTLRAPSPLSELNSSRLFKPVTMGGTVAGTTAQGFTNSGNALRPYSPVLLGGGTDGSGNVTLNWTRRTRIGGAWVPFNDVPLSESSEAYVVQIWNSDYTQVARIITGITSATTTYTSAQQVTDFGAQQQTIYFTVAQVGTVLGRSARGTAVGAGSTDDDPVSPIPPYQSPTSGSPDPPPTLDSLDLSLTWGNVRTYSYLAGAFACDKIVVASFTTPGSSLNNVRGNIICDEWGVGTGPITRVGCLSTVPGDFSGTVLGPRSRAVSSAPNIQFTVGTNTAGYPQLSPSTTYYYNVKNDNGFGACTCFTSDCGIFVELHKPTGL